MELNMKIIGRKLDDGWPNRIKLVLVSGISFAGRKHDIGDILYYISNYRTQLNQHIHNTFEDFVNEFQKSQYNGPIPVLIADQDVHRLTIDITGYGLNVSELCPANSYNIFGGYWQQDEPHLEEKIALTTIGLLVQTLSH
jgi:hypothetical protein